MKKQNIVLFVYIGPLSIFYKQLIHSVRLLITLWIFVFVYNFHFC
ncbi:hypothetical protein A225_2387 [Klebsiella michiganensis E718]|nr:hypothetical protein A225_2387 [Klebsiella michiganensis E718]